VYDRYNDIAVNTKISSTPGFVTGFTLWVKWESYWRNQPKTNTGWWSTWRERHL